MRKTHKHDSPTSAEGVERMLGYEPYGQPVPGAGQILSVRWTLAGVVVTRANFEGRVIAYIEHNGAWVEIIPAETIK